MWPSALSSRDQGCEEAQKAHTEQAWRQLLKECQDVTTFQLFASNATGSAAAMLQCDAAVPRNRT